MYETQGDYLMTYGPTCYEEHAESTDFEERIIPNVGSRKGNHSLLNTQVQQPQRSIHHQNNTYEDYDKYPVKLHEFSGTEVQIGPQRVKIKGKNLNGPDQVSISTHTVHSKMSVFKHKLIPCISSLFKRSNKKNVKENPVENDVDNCQYCNYCDRRRVRKLYKRQNYAVQPVYALEGIHKTQALFEQTKLTKEPLKLHVPKKSTNQYSACSLSSSSESEIQLVKERQKKIRRFKKKLKSEFVKERLKYQQNQHFKNQNLQFPAKDLKSPYHVFSSSCHQTVSSRVSHDSDIKYLTDMPSSSSGFWDYLFDRFNRKYTTNRVEMPNSCTCGSSEVTCTPENCHYREKGTNAMNGLSLKIPAIDKSQKKIKNHVCECTQVPEVEDENQSCKCTQLPDLKETIGVEDTGVQAGDQIKSLAPSPKVNCQCPGNDKTAPSDDKPSPPVTTTAKSGPESTKPCQEGHDELTSTLAEKYNGEILCIHNPPCILINGCLNLPSQQNRQQTTDLWSVTDTKKSGFCEGFRRKKGKSKWEQGCQYHTPYVNVQQCHLQEYKPEKIIQSVCHHTPPCEIVRSCFKPKFDPELQNSCIHVPMCSKIPQCTMAQPEAKLCCDHRPKCQEIPLCSRNRNYAVLTARETVATQARPRETLVCRHVPPCIMIPKCLGRTIFENCVPFDAIPGCVHQPPCDMIPACCRKATKEMVTASSQYPNSCRIV